MKNSLSLCNAYLTTFAIAQKKQTTTSAILNFDATTLIDALPTADNTTVIVNDKDSNV
jgi:hypothetical protein